MTDATPPRWITDIADVLESPRHPIVFGARIDDPALAPLLDLPPTLEDLRDAGRRGGEAGRQAFLRRRALLRSLVARRLGCAAKAVLVAHDAAGAPQLIAPAAGLFLSVSSRAGFAAFALSGSPIGVDLEVVGPPEEPAWNVLHPSEQAALRSVKPEERHLAFLRIWTMKEAWLKRQGLGLSVEPAGLAVDLVSGAVSFPHPETRPSDAPQDDGYWGRFTAAQWRIFTLAGTPLIVACAYS